MDLTLSPGLLSGQLQIIPSKSQAHRLLICAAFSDRPTKLICYATNQDIEATAACLNAFGANIVRTHEGYDITPVREIPKAAKLNCEESGSTLRFLLPIAGSLGIDTIFVMSGRLPHRPLSPLWEEMERMGCVLSRPAENEIRCSGRLCSGEYQIAGNISSQFISGLLFAMALLPGESSLTVTGKTESLPYIRMTQNALSSFGVHTDHYHVKGNYPFLSPKSCTVEGDWSNGAFFLAANAVGSTITVDGLAENSAQGDRVITELLQKLEENIVIDAADIPDLIPILSVVAAAKKGATFHHINRLRLKESDRVASVAAMLAQLGVKTDISQDSLTVYPSSFHGCIIDSAGDHRIAMSAAIAATIADSPVTVLGAHCVAKSYPDFWMEYKKLGGNYVEYIR